MIDVGSWVGRWDEVVLCGSVRAAGREEREAVSLFASCYCRDHFLEPASSNTRLVFCGSFVLAGRLMNLTV